MAFEEKLPENGLDQEAPAEEAPVEEAPQLGFIEVVFTEYQLLVLVACLQATLEYVELPEQDEFDVAQLALFLTAIYRNKDEFRPGEGWFDRMERARETIEAATAAAESEPREGAES